MTTIVRRGDLGDALPKTGKQYPYTALYRQWRPQLFPRLWDRNMLPTAECPFQFEGSPCPISFAGSGGQVKTYGKLLAKALIVGRGQDEPCNTAPLNAEGSTDVLKSCDANPSIEEIRISKKSGILTGRYKVYIIDEVHMLTKAFHAFSRHWRNLLRGVFIWQPLKFTSFPLR